MAKFRELYPFGWSSRDTFIDHRQIDRATKMMITLYFFFSIYLTIFLWFSYYRVVLTKLDELQIWIYEYRNYASGRWLFIPISYRIIVTVSHCHVSKIRHVQILAFGKIRIFIRIQISVFEKWWFYRIHLRISHKTVIIVSFSIA